MKVKIEMTVKVSKEGAEAWDVESHLRDALAMYEGNEIEFQDCNIESCRPTLKEFPRDAREVECIESFTVTHTNSVGGEIVKREFQFVKGIIYSATSWRPEGMTVDGFFVFHQNAAKFVLFRQQRPRRGINSPANSGEWKWRSRKNSGSR